MVLVETAGSAGGWLQTADGHQTGAAVTASRRRHLRRHVGHCSLHVILWSLLQWQRSTHSLTKPSHTNQLGLPVRQSTITILLLLSPRADTHSTVPRRVDGWVDLGTAVRVCSPCPRLYIAVAVVINTTARSEVWTWDLSHRSQACYH